MKKRNFLKQKINLESHLYGGLKIKEWYKNCIYGTAKLFRDVHLDKEEIENFTMEQKSFLSESN